MPFFTMRTVPRLLDDEEAVRIEAAARSRTAARRARRRRHGRRSRVPATRRHAGAERRRVLELARGRAAVAVGGVAVVALLPRPRRRRRRTMPTAVHDGAGATWRGPSRPRSGRTSRSARSRRLADREPHVDGPLRLRDRYGQALLPPVTDNVPPRAPTVNCTFLTATPGR